MELEYKSGNILSNNPKLKMIKISELWNNLINTGERPLLGKDFQEITPTLRFAYEYAGKLVKIKSAVLDYGCGGGYGTEFLSRKTQSKVVGFDIDCRTIRFNRKFYQARKNLFFFNSKKDLKKEVFDITVSFQVIEHLPDKFIINYLREIKSLTKVNGLILFSTVNKNLTSKGLAKPTMPFHEKEYYPDELKKFLNKYFPKVVLYGQKEIVKKNNISKIARISKNNFKQNLLRLLSQIDLIRFLARHTPLFLKDYFFNYNCESEFKKYYKVTKNPKEIDECYVIICECRNAE